MDVRSIASAYGATPLNTIAKSDPKAAPEKSTAAHNEQSEHVEFSATSLSMQKLSDIIDATPDVRIKVVEEIKTKIKYNGYPLESNLYKALENMVKDKII